MIKVGLTGNIGSGKTTVSEIFDNLGIPVYNSDTEAKKFLSYTDVVSKLINRFGDRILTNSKIDNKKIAGIVFNDNESLEFLNQLIHPLVAYDFNKWCDLNQNKSYVIIESAILYESGFDKFVNKVIFVSAPEEIRIKRIVNRDNCDVDEVKKRISKQWDESIKIKLADYNIINDGKKELFPQVIEIHNILTGSR